MIIDTHAHLFIGDILQDIEEVLKRAEQSGIERIIIPAVDVPTSIQILTLCNKYSMLKAAVGIHPTDVSKAVESDLIEIEKIAADKNVCAIGEIGLDYYWEPYDKELQQYFLKAQIKIAKTLELPVILHNRNSSEDLMKIVKKETNDEKLSGQFHSFSGNLRMAMECIALGYYISFTGNITYKPNQNTITAYEIIKNTPLENLLLETDSPYLPPIPYRGKRNEPSYIVNTAKKIAELKDIEPDVLYRQTTENAKVLYKI